MFTSEKNFKYPSCEITFGNAKDIGHWLAKLAQILEILKKNTFKVNLR